MVRVMVVVLLFAMTIYALVDVYRTPDDQTRLLPPPIWALVILVFPPLGALAWLSFGSTRGWFGGYADQVDAGPRPKAPDDDEDFLRGL